MSGPASTSKGSRPSTPRNPVLNSPALSARTDDDGDNNEGEEQEEDESDEDAWDEVDVNAKDTAGIEIVLSKPKNSKSNQSTSKRKGPTPEQRMIRQETHKLHTTCLLASGLIRNQWLNDQEVHARLLSQAPAHILEAFHSFSKLTHPNDRDRTRLFDAAVKDLVVWWWSTFKIFEGRGIFRPPGVQLFSDRLAGQADAVQEEDEAIPGSGPKKSNAKGKAREQTAASARELAGIACLATIELTLSNLKSAGGEWVKSIKSIRKHAGLMAGSRDMSAQLFTALCRGLEIPTRLVFSLQPIDWKSPPSASTTTAKSRSSVAKKTSVVGGWSSKKKIPVRATSKAKGKEVIDVASLSEEDQTSRADDDDGRDDRAYGGDDAGTEGSTSTSKPVIRLRATKAVRKNMDALDPNDPTRAPVFWTEVYSRSHREWIPVDPLRKRMRCRGIMEPQRSELDNRMLYVVAFEEDGVTRDVTMRYAKKYTSFTVKARVPSRKGTDWFKSTLAPFVRTFQLNRDVAEDEELLGLKANEAMPSTVAAFKDHPNYVLSRHLKRDDAILPLHTKIADFMGSKGGSEPEPIFARSSIVTVKSVEAYMKVGRRVKDNEIPMKWVKARSVTIGKKRAEEAAKELDIEGEDDRAGQPLYSEEQTELYVAQPIVDGKIPKNEFGNIDLYVPSMLPAGGVHIPYKTAAKCAKKLTIPFAEAVTGFEFKQRRAYPVLTGIVVAIEFEEIIMAAIEENDRIDEAKDFAKLQERVTKRWAKLIRGLRIRERLQADLRKDQARLGHGTNGGVQMPEKSQLGTHAEPGSESRKRKAADRFGDSAALSE